MLWADACDLQRCCMFMLSLQPGASKLPGMTTPCLTCCLAPFHMCRKHVGNLSDSAHELG
jgi:hypothetical protein